MAESPPTIYDVANEAGVSIATVSRVLNGFEQTRAATRDRVLAAVRDLGFVPNGAARGLSRGSKRILGLVFAHTPADDDLLAEEEGSLLFTDSIVRGAEQSAERQGYSLLLSGAGGEHGDHAASVNALTGKTDGLILLDRVLPEGRVAAIGKRFPLVLLAGSGRSRSALTVRVDNEGGMRAVAEHLLVVHGLQRMAFVSGFADSPDSVARSTAFRQAVAGHRGRPRGRELPRGGLDVVRGRSCRAATAGSRRRRAGSDRLRQRPDGSRGDVRTRGRRAARARGRRRRGL